MAFNGVRVTFGNYLGLMDMQRKAVKLDQVSSRGIRGHRKNRDRVGDKKGFREGDSFMGQGGGREGEFLKK